MRKEEIISNTWWSIQICIIALDAIKVLEPNILFKSTKTVANAEICCGVEIKIWKCENVKNI